MSFYSQDYQPVYWSSSRCGKQTTSGRNLFFSALKVTRENLTYSWNPCSSQVCPGSNVPFLCFWSMIPEKKRKKKKTEEMIIKLFTILVVNKMAWFSWKKLKMIKFLMSIFVYITINSNMRFLDQDRLLLLIAILLSVHCTTISTFFWGDAIWTSWHIWVSHNRRGALKLRIRDSISCCPLNILPSWEEKWFSLMQTNSPRIEKGKFSCGK